MFVHIDVQSDVEGYDVVQISGGDVGHAAILVGAGRQVGVTLVTLVDGQGHDVDGERLGGEIRAIRSQRIALTGTILTKNMAIDGAAIHLRDPGDVALDNVDTS
jgi:hypothetical protein